jgi:hypothetical protein
MAVLNERKLVHVCQTHGLSKLSGTSGFTNEESANGI